MDRRTDRIPISISRINVLTRNKKFAAQHKISLLARGHGHMDGSDDRKVCFYFLHLKITCSVFKTWPFEQHAE